MARIESIKQRLENWALWRARMDSNGLGYHSVNVLASDVWGRGSYNGTYIPHINDDAELIDKAVAALKLAKPLLHTVVTAHHLEYLSVQEVAHRTCRALSTVHGQLAAADQFVQSWLREQLRQADEKAALERGRQWLSSH